MVRQSLPTSGIEAFLDLEAFLSQASRAHLPLSEIERESERRGRELLRLCLQAHLDNRGPGDVGPALLASTPTGAVRLTHKRLHTRAILTVFGEVSFTRVGYGARGHPSVHPLDAQLCLPERIYSYEICRRLVRAAACGPFDEAIGFIEEMTGVKVPKASAYQIVTEAAADFDTFYASRERSSPKVGRGEILVGAIDCKGIPMVKPEGATTVIRRGKGDKTHKKKMATVGAVYSQAPLVRTPTEVIDSLFATPGACPQREKRKRPTDKRVWASLVSGKDSFIGDVRAEMLRRDPRHRHTWVMVTDGERALQRRVGQVFPGVTLALDLLHVLEKLWKAGHALHPEGSPEAVAFVRDRAERILSGQVSQVVKGLRQIATKRPLSPAKTKALRDVADYYYANRERMRYDIYLQNGWPIASGSVEGACKHLVRDRFERSGMRWSPAMAEAMLKLRAIYLSGDLNEYWVWHVAQDQQRLYPKGSWRVVRE
jgi:hypothetical protein